jgi:hypothetical protein
MLVVTLLYAVESAGKKVTLSDWAPAPGADVGFVNAKLPETEVLPETADPPLRVDDARVWP